MFTLKDLYFQTIPLPAYSNITITLFPSPIADNMLIRVKTKVVKGVVIEVDLLHILIPKGVMDKVFKDDEKILALEELVKNV